MPKTTIQDHDFAQKHVFLRADLNVPLKNGCIADATRLEALLPTLKLLCDQGAVVTLATHIGRPQALLLQATPGFADPSKPNHELSSKPIASWLSDHGFGQVQLLENLRFYPGEQSTDTAQRLAFAQQLATGMDAYINDAFGTLHRNDASIALLPTLFPVSERFYGLCIARELEHLDYLRAQPEKPYVAVLGGNKLADKLPLITRLLKAPEPARITHLLLGGTIGTAIQADQNQTLQRLAAAQGVVLVLPEDMLGTTDIGPRTAATYAQIIASARTVLANGTMGMYEELASQDGTKAILEAIADNPHYTVIGGGDCAAAADQFGLAERIHFISTGGGATLAYLAAGEPWRELPGLIALQ